MHHAAHFTFGFVDAACYFTETLGEGFGFAFQEGMACGIAKRRVSWLLGPRGGGGALAYLRK